jgi:hypothetical protein
VQYGRKDGYEVTSDTIAYNCRRVYLVIEGVGEKEVIVLAA